MKFSEKLLFDKKYQGENELRTDLQQLIDNQLAQWKLARNNYNGLNHTLQKTFDFGDYVLNVQFNPERIRSSAAKVDPKSIKERKCFLCAANLPEEQKALLFQDRFLILINPYPIFRKHLTIPATEHRPQRILNDFSIITDLAKALPDYIFFYNGPKCGASAPDHFHIQGGNKGFLPIETEFEQLKKTHKPLFLKDQKSQIWFIKDYLRKMISIESTDPIILNDTFLTIYKNLALLFPEAEEPMLNIIGYQQNGHFIIHLFPRKKHRPDQFFAEGEDQLLISPASVDFGGVFITPRQEDFDKITAADLIDIFKQVSMDEAQFEILESEFKSTR